MDVTRADEARILELLADRATEGLGPEELSELTGMLAHRPELDDDSFDLAAAAIELAYTDVSEELPAGMRSRLLESATEVDRPGCCP